MDVLVLQCFVSFLALKNEAYTCVLSLFRRAFVPFHSFKDRSIYLCQKRLR